MQLRSVPYVELPPRSDLRDHVACVWIERPHPDGRPFRDRVLPDAWVDVVWGRRLWVRGPDTRRHGVSYGADRVFMALRLRRGAAHAVLGVPALELVDGRASIGDLWRREGDELEERLAETEGPGAAVALLQDAVAHRLATARPTDAAVAAAAAELEARPRVRIRELAGELGLSERHLRRRCRTALGYGPRTLGRILRLERLRRLAVADTAATLAELAFRAGYADQAHMARDCRGLAGETPAAFVARERVRFVQDPRRLGA